MYVGRQLNIHNWCWRSHTRSIANCSSHPRTAHPRCLEGQESQLVQMAARSGIMGAAALPAAPSAAARASRALLQSLPCVCRGGGFACSTSGSGASLVRSGGGNSGAGSGSRYVAAEASRADGASASPVKTVPVGASRRRARSWTVAHTRRRARGGPKLQCRASPRAGPERSGAAAQARHRRPCLGRPPPAPPGAPPRPRALKHENAGPHTPQPPRSRLAGVVQPPPDHKVPRPAAARAQRARRVRRQAAAAGAGWRDV